MVGERRKEKKRPGLLDTECGGGGRTRYDLEEVPAKAGEKPRRFTEQGFYSRCAHPVKVRAEKIDQYVVQGDGM
jgi:hypothetical protein